MCLRWSASSLRRRWGSRPSGQRGWRPGRVRRAACESRACVEVARRIARDPTVASVIVVARRGSIVADELGSERYVQLLELPPARLTELARRLVWEAIGLPRLIRLNRPVSVLSWSGMLPRHLDAPLVCFLSNPVAFEQSKLGHRLRRHPHPHRHLVAPLDQLRGAIYRLVGHRPVGNFRRLRHLAGDFTNRGGQFFSRRGNRLHVDARCLHRAGDVGRHSSIAVDASGVVHISYIDDTHGDLKYATLCP